jgi:protoheme IX farnesyltransferase
MGVGLVALAAIRWEVALVGLLALLIYVFVYTPLKRVGPIAVVVGAIPGALPPVIGYWASQPVFDHQLWVLFGVQFLWQFPHFWIIAWISREDYERAGFRLLPFLDEKSNRLAILAVSFLLSLSGLVVGLYSGLGAGLWTGLLGLGVLGMAIRFYRRPELLVARQFLIGLTIFLTLFYLGLWLWSQR